jgi:cytochrome d ubiquinol oxidase subunit II
MSSTGCLPGGGYHRGRAPRQLIDDTITPLWEANHVWLIFVLVIFRTAFPPAFAAVMTAAALPLWLAAFGIVLRGAGLAFRKEVEALHWQRLFGFAPYGPQLTSDLPCGHRLRR